MPISVFHHYFISFLSVVPQEFFLRGNHTDETDAVQASRISKHEAVNINH